MILNISLESVETLRTWSEGIFLAKQGIEDSTKELVKSCQSLSGKLGVHENTFIELVASVQSFQEKAQESLEVLPEMLYKTADKMEAYIYNQPYNEDDPGWQRIRKKR